MKPYRVWLVDDDVDDVFLAKSAAKQLANRVDLASLSSGRELLQSIQEVDESEMPDLVLLDLNMPGLNGLQVLEQRRANLKKFVHVPMVVLSTADNSEQIKECYRLGASAYVVKPSEFEDFVVALGRIFDFWLLTNSRLSQSATS
ncbi:response regulator [Gilvimarinus sp. SDUM040013]|uniref:Response regulator n=1 Tax=Gilvimarinus gilvus TaxID=3058038 RepID=A0ABU4S116_9GAMM|nr:response regulator [Gilvimarinus sp. SDUM040013]MDO3384822.1 response regulator [Gilvimarinus sp. SDUM040013]MDX6850845.1 response regulator [Gilvimarinus sp. SDUM040013]